MHISVGFWKNDIEGGRFRTEDCVVFIYNFLLMACACTQRVHI